MFLSGRCPNCGRTLIHVCQSVLICTVLLHMYCPMRTMMLISRYLFRGDADVERCVVDLKLNKPKMNQFLKIK